MAWKTVVSIASGATIAAALAACGSTIVDRSSSGGTGGSGGSGGSGTTTTSSTASGQGGCAGEDCGPTTTVGAGGSIPCGGLTDRMCPDESYYCAFDDSTCGGDDTGGTCRLKPEACDKHIELVCGCDGKIYDNPCEAEKAGVSPTDSKACMFDCNGQKCAARTEYCQLTTVGGMIEDAACLPIPDACNGQASCDCISCSSCSDSPPGDVTVTCEGEF